MSNHLFPIGTKYLTRHKHSRLCTVTDQLTVTNAAGETVKYYYTSEHKLTDQTVTNHEVVETTIAIGVENLRQKIAAGYKLPE